MPVLLKPYASCLNFVFHLVFLVNDKSHSLANRITKRLSRTRRGNEPGPGLQLSRGSLWDAGGSGSVSGHRDAE